MCARNLEAYVNNKTILITRCNTEYFYSLQATLTNLKIKNAV